MSNPIRVIPTREPDSERLTNLLDERRRLRVRLAELEGEIDELLVRRATATRPTAQRERLAYRIEEVAKLIGVSEMSVRRAIDRGDLQAVSMDRRANTGVRLVRASDLEAWLEDLGREGG